MTFRGSGQDVPPGVATDGANNIYVTGVTGSAVRCAAEETRAARVVHSQHETLIPPKNDRSRRARLCSRGARRRAVRPATPQRIHLSQRHRRLVPGTQTQTRRRPRTDP
ncbi:MAG: SBBP repeat-containing protein [Bryobacteraceae bacterium]